ncbi:hypothetical protein [Thermincola potens]|nr:hypothetical protein [Thermincola potens]
MPFVVTATYAQNINRYISLAAGALSVLAGVLMMASITAEMVA